MTTDELKTLLNSGRPEKIDEAIECLVTLLTSRDGPTRHRGYELFEEGLKEALYRSCLDYGSLAGGFTQPLMAVITRTVEFWATQHPSAAH